LDKGFTKKNNLPVVFVQVCNSKGKQQHSRDSLNAFIRITIIALKSWAIMSKSLKSLLNLLIVYIHWEDLQYWNVSRLQHYIMKGRF